MVSKKEYAQMSKKASPPTKSWKNIPCAFVIGGLICTLGQIIKNLFIHFGVSEENAATWCSICLVVLSALLTGLGLYEKLAKHAGAGTLVPITGFANSISASALEAKSEGFILGVGAKIFTIAGPVILYGTAASVVYGIIYYIARQF